MTTVEQLHVHDRATYRITVQGCLDERWSDYADRFVRKHGITVIDPHQDPTGAVALTSIAEIAPLFDAINAA